MDKDTIEAIPKTMESFFGCSGKMVRPSAATVKEVLKKSEKEGLSPLSMSGKNWLRTFVFKPRVLQVLPKRSS